VGKSTLAAALGRRGHPVLTDDVAAVGRRHGLFLIHPGPARLRPRRPAARDFRSRDRSPTRSMPDACFDFDLASAEFTQPQAPVALAAICVLEPQSDRPGLGVEPLSAADAAVSLLRDTWARQLQDRAMRAQEFEEVSRLVDGTTAYRMTYAMTDDWLTQACELVERGFMTDSYAPPGGGLSR
jgi:hypothetical protein